MKRLYISPARRDCQSLWLTPFDLFHYPFSNAISLKPLLQQMDGLNIPKCSDV